MIAVSLVHIAILTNLAFSHVAGTHFNSTVAIEHNTSNGIGLGRWHWNPTPEAPVEKIVLRETTLCEKYGIGIEPAAAPDEETIALADKAHHFVSSINWIAQRKDVPAPKPELAIRANWTKRFAVQWDDDGGFTLAGKYFPKPDDGPTYQFGGGLTVDIELNR